MLFPWHMCGGPTCSFMIRFSLYTSVACKPNSGNKTLSRSPAILLQNGSVLGTLRELLVSSARSCSGEVSLPFTTLSSHCRALALPH